MGTKSVNPDARFDVPAWAAFFTPSEYADFVRLVTVEQVQRGALGDVHQGSLRLHRPGGLREDLSLLNLAQICKGGHLGQWPKLIKEFFDNLGKGVETAHDLMSGLANFAAIRSQLKLRLVPEDYMQSEAHLLVRRKIVDGVAALLVCDMGHANVTVPLQLLDVWQRPVDELMDLGRQNVRAAGLLPVIPSPPMLGFSVELLTSGSNYAATHLLFFEEYCQPARGFGALVSVPNRHTIFRHLIQDRGVLEAVQLMQDVTQQAYNHGPGSISPSIYWWRPGNLHKLGVQRVGDTLLFAPGQEFETQVLAPLARGN